MKKNRLVVIATVVAGFLFLLLPACCLTSSAAGPLDKAECPIWNIGDIRTYRISGDGKNSTQTEPITAVSNEGYTVVIEKTDGKKTTELYSPELMLIKTFDSSGKVVDKYDSGVYKIKWPFKAGDSWSVDHIAHNKKSGTLLMGIDSEVTAETLVIDGKEIPTLKLMNKSKLQKSGLYIDKLERWYDPAAGCFRKSILTRLIGDVGEKNYMKELTSFTPGGAK